jgi:hypothetical protein
MTMTASRRLAALVATATMMAQAPGAARAEPYEGTIAGYGVATVTYMLGSSPGELPDPITYSGPATLLYFIDARPGGNGGPVFGEVLFYLSAGPVNIGSDTGGMPLIVSGEDSAPGTGADRIGGTQQSGGFYLTSFHLSDPSGNFFETGVLGYGATVGADYYANQTYDPFGTSTFTTASFRVVVVPEPSTLLMSAAGVGAVVSAVGRRRLPVA